MPDYSPEFRRALATHVSYLKRNLEHTPEGREALVRVMEIAPESFKESLRSMAREFGLEPPPAGYLQDGSPVYSAASIADRLGISTGEIEARLREAESMGLSVVADPALVASVQ